MTRILLTGFEPFLGRSVNPSWEAVRQLDGEVINGAWVRAVRVPVVYGGSVRVIAAELDREPVDALVIGGLAYGRAAVNVEALAHAVGDMPWSPDNAGRALANARTMASSGIDGALVPVVISGSAGTCKYVARSPGILSRP